MSCIPRNKSMVVGDIFIQKTKLNDSRQEEYLIVTSLEGFGFLFDIYFADPWTKELATSPGEGKIKDIEDGLKDGDIIKATESDFVAFKALLLLTHS